MNILRQWLESKAPKIQMGARQKMLICFILPLLTSFLMLRFADLKDGQKSAYLDYSATNALVLAGHQVYVEQGCQYCHTMNLMPFPKDYIRFAPEQEDERLPDLLKQSDVQLETPLRLGSRRLAPDLSRIHGRISEDELRILLTLRNEKLRSISHPYGFLFERFVNPVEISWKIRAIMQTSPNVYFSDAYQRSVIALLEDVSEGEALIAYLLSRGIHSYQNERNFFTR